jgi:hypothetical protein
MYSDKDIYFFRTNRSECSPFPITATCPHCSHKGVFQKQNNERPDITHQIIRENKIIYVICASVRTCPNPSCSGVVFLLCNMSGEVKLFDCYPHISIDFDQSNIPPKISMTMKEAIECHSHGCFIAAAIMIRRTLEELCHDRQCTGNTLHAKLNDLKSKVILPSDLLDASMELKILGNDAAHVEAKDYAMIGEQEVKLAIDLAKELLKAVYQYSNLLSRLRGMRAPSQP